MPTVSWASGVNGDWSQGANWNPGSPPGPGDSALIAIAGNYTVSVTTAISVASLAINDGTATVAIQDPGNLASIAGDLVTSGLLAVDGNFTTAGSSLKIGGTLTNSSRVVIGNTAMGAVTTVTAAALANTGELDITGNTGAGTTSQASLDIAALAPDSWTSTLNLVGDALLQFGDGQIGTIASGASLSLSGAEARVADAVSPSSNSALAGLHEVDGTFAGESGASVSTTGDLTNTGQLRVDDNFTVSGSSLTIGGTLTNSSRVVIGNTAMGTVTTVTAGALANTGELDITGNTGAGTTSQASLDVAALAPDSWTSTLNLVGDALLQFSDGQIGTIASGASLALSGAEARVADAVSPSSNSALAGLHEVDGTFAIESGASVSTTGDLTNTGQLRVDDNFTVSGSSLTIGGTLTNASRVAIGNTAMGAVTTVTAAALANTGELDITGNTGAGTTSQASLDVAVLAPDSWTSTLNLVGDALLQFGNGQIGTIASGASLSLSGAEARVADAVDPATNSALAGLHEVDGTFAVESGASVATTGDLTNTGQLRVDDNFTVSGSSLTIGGTLTNSSRVVIGNTAMGAVTTVTAAALANSGELDITGNTGAGTTSQASLDIAALAPDSWTSTLNLVGDALLQFSDGQIGTIASGASLALSGAEARVADAVSPSSNSALAGLHEVDGTFAVESGASVSTTGDLTNTGQLRVDDNFTVSGSSLTIGGTLTNSNRVVIGNTAMGDVTTVTAAALANSGELDITGNTGAGTISQASLDIAALAPDSWTSTLNLVGDALLQFSDGQIGTIASGASLSLLGAEARVADAINPATNSALAGLHEVDGTFAVESGASVATTGDLTNTGQLRIDDNFTVSGSSLTIGGTLTNASRVAIGNTAMGTVTTVTAAALANTGELDITGNTGAGTTSQASLDVAALAPDSWTSTLNLTGDALLGFGDGQIGTIASGASLSLSGAKARVADAVNPATNSALAGLHEVDGTFAVESGASVSTTGDLTNTGQLRVDDNFTVSGSSLTIGGTLTNSSRVVIGNAAMGAVTTVTAAALANIGELDILGNTGSSTPTTSLSINGAIANSGLVNIGSETDLTVGGLYTQTAGGANISGTLSAANLVVTGGSLQLVGGVIQASVVSLASDASLFGHGSVQPQISGGGTIEALGGTLDLAGGVTGAASLEIGAGAALDLGGAISEAVDFMAPNGVLVLDQPLNFTGTISGFSLDDTLVLRNVSATGATTSFDSATDTSTLAIALSGGGTLDVALAGNYAGEQFGITQAGSDAEIGVSGAAGATINTPGPIDLGTVRAGSSDTAAISITNNAPANSAALDASIGGLVGDAIGSGAITDLAPGATDAADITVGINTANGGVQNGTATIDFASVVGGGNTSTLPSQSVAVFGTVYREAVAAITPGALVAHVGDPGKVALAITNTAPADGFSEDLIASLINATGGITIAGGATATEIAPGTSDATDLSVSFSTAQTGIVSGNVTVALTSDGGSGSGSIDGLGTIALPSQILPISIAIDNYATAALETLSHVGSLTASGGTETLDLGTIAQGSGPLTLDLGVINAAGGPADLLSGSYIATASNGFTLSGLDAFSGLSAGQADTAPQVTLDTGTAGVVNQTITLLSTGSNASGYSAALNPVTLTITGTVAPLPGPSIDGPATLTAAAAVPLSIGKLSITDSKDDGLPLVVTLSDSAGLLTARANGNGSVGGDNTNTLTLIGDLADINAELATVAYTDATIGSDTINVGVTDGHNATAQHSVAVDVQAVPFTLPVFNSPTSVLVAPGTASGVGGLSVSDPYAEANGQQITVVFSSQVGTLSVTGDYGGSILGQGTGTLAITGTVPQINAYLGDGLLEDLGEALIQNAFDFTVDKTVGFIKTGTIDLLPTQEDIIKIGGGPEGKFFDLGVTSAVFALDSLIGLIPGNTLPSKEEFIKALTEIIGDPHIVTPSGAIYDFNAEGEFVLAAATQPGDSFDVQVRLQAFNNSPYASSVTQVGAQIGTDRITFATGRGAMVWVDGAAVTLSTAEPLTLSGGEVTELSSDSYRVTWNTGEVLNVTNAGEFLDVSVAVGPNNSPGSIVGLAALADSTTDQFQLPDGSVLQSPLSSQTLYGAYADAWRVPQSDSLLDYAAGQTTATFTNQSFPQAYITLADLPASVVAQAAAVVAAAGITDPGAAAAAEFDYIVSGGDPGIVAADASFLTGVTTTSAQATRVGPAPLAIGVIADAAKVVGDDATTTAIVFDAYLTTTSVTDTTIDYTVVTPGTNDLGLAAFGGTLPSGQVTIAAGQISGQFTIDVPAGGLGQRPNSLVAVQISSPDGTPVLAADAEATIVQAIPGPPAKPVLQDLTNLGSFSGSGTSYTLDLGEVQYGSPVPSIQLAIKNGAASPSDSLSATIDVAPVEGFSATGTSLPAPLDGGASYQGIYVTINSVKFGPNSETITFNPTDSNVTGFSQTLAPITLTITDTIVPPTMVFSYAWGDVHIITYNGLRYDFQGEGEFTLAKSRVPTDTFDIQLRLQPWFAGASVSIITEVAVSVGSDRVTFDLKRPDTVWVNGNPSSISQDDPIVNLNGGKLEQISPSVWQVTWDTGEEATITNAGSFLNVSDGIPLAAPNTVGGLQGEDAGAVNDFQLSDGTVLPQPLTTAQLYGEYADSWRVSQAASLFDYAPGQTTATFTDRNFPTDVVTLADLPQNLVAAAAQAVAAAGITDPGIAQAAELDFIATNDPSFITAAQQVATQVTNTTPVTFQASVPPPPAVGVEASPAGLTEATSGPTTVTFDAYLSHSVSADTQVNYTVVAAGAGYFDASTFGGVSPSGSLTITAGQTLIPFTIDLPEGALGALPNEKLEVQVSAPGGDPLFAPLATATITNDTAEPGAPAVPQFVELTNQGTLIQNSVTAYTLDLGTLYQGQSIPNVQLALLNTAGAPADDLSGIFGAPLGSGFTVIGNNLSSAIAAGSRYDGLYIGATTSQTGSFSETLTFAPRDVNDSGYSAALPLITLTVTDTVVGVGTGQLDTPQNIIFPNVHVGAAESQSLVVANVASSGAVDASASVSSPFITQGTITGLAPGVTDTTSLFVGLDTSTAGSYSGVAQVTFSPGRQSVPSMVDVFGSVYREASANITPLTAIVHVGDPGSLALNVGNVAVTDRYSENLIASLAAVSGGFSNNASGPTGDIAPGASDSGALTVGFSTAQAATLSGIATVDLTSDGGTGASSIDGLGQTALAPQDIPLSVTVNNFAQATLVSDGKLTPTGAGATSYVLNLGTVIQGGAAPTVDLSVVNSAAGPSDWLNGSYSVQAAPQFINQGFAAFNEIGAGATAAAGTITLHTDQIGSFSETVVLQPTDSNSGGYSAVLNDETVTVIGTIVAPTGLAQGDVHMATFDGLHYAFQATGDFVLARSTAATDPFQIQIRTDSLGQAGVSYTTGIAARIGNDVVTFAVDRASPVWIDGAADTLGTTPQQLSGGQLVQVSDDSYQLTWSSGETLTVTDQASYLDLSVTLSPQDAPYHVQGLLGSDSGQANDFQLPDGTVLQQPLSDNDIVSWYADAWRVAPQASLLANNLSGSLAPDRMQFLHPASAPGGSATAPTFAVPTNQLATPLPGFAAVHPADLLMDLAGGVKPALLDMTDWIGHPPSAGGGIAGPLHPTLIAPQATSDHTVHAAVLS